MKLRAAALGGSILFALHCGGTTVPLGGGTGAQSSGSDAGAMAGDPPTFDDPGFPTLSVASKVDVLLAVDDSPGMAAKSEYFARSLRSFLTHVAQIAPDIHVGVITSSLGNQGGDVCDASNPHTNTKAHLQRLDEHGVIVVPDGVSRLDATGAVPTFIDEAERLVRGVGQDGCGLEAQLESMYRFLVEPDPRNEVQLDPFKQAVLSDDVDVDLLADRKAFLRPDSLVVVIMVTDEDDSTPDPLSVGGFGYAFAARNFPGSTVRRGTVVEGTTAPRGTTACESDPGSAACTSCGFAPNCDQQKADCQAVRSDPNCVDSPFHAPAEDDLNVRFFHMKERFGVDPQFPVDRYLAGFSASAVPDSAREHAVTFGPNGQRIIADYTYRKSCTNPLFATSLPVSPGDELCRLPRGPRSPDLVVFGVLAGVPSPLAEQPTVSWPSILGNDPEHWDYTGIDPHMVQSLVPRTALLAGGDPSSPKGKNGTDPVSGREWLTKNKDLQYACTFDLETPIACADGDPSCDCAEPYGVVPTNPPLCAATPPTTQLKGKAYPSTRELLLAKKMGARAMIGSVCPPAGQTSYTPFMTRLEGLVLPRLRGN